MKILLKEEIGWVEARVEDLKKGDVFKRWDHSDSTHLALSSAFKNTLVQGGWGISCALFNEEEGGNGAR